MASIRAESSGRPTRSRASGQIEEAQECILGAVQRIIGPQAFPAHHSNKARPVLMHQNGDPAVKAVPTRPSVRRSGHVDGPQIA
jgi:hypothetical protein